MAPLGRVAQDNGFTLTLAEEELAADAFARARSRLKASSKWIARLTAEGAQISIEFGVFVPAGAPRSVAFPKDLLKCMVEMDLSVVTRAYPVAEDEDE